MKKSCKKCAFKKLCITRTMVDDAAAHLYETFRNALTYLDAKKPTSVANRMHNDIIDTLYEHLASTCDHYTEALPEYEEDE